MCDTYTHQPSISLFVRQSDGNTGFPIKGLTGASFGIRLKPYVY